MVKRVSYIGLMLSMAFALISCGSTTLPVWQEQYDLGMQYLTDGDYESAIVAFTESIETGPKLAALYIARGDAYSAWAEETEAAALEALSDGETLEWSEITISTDDGSTYTLEELYENAISDYEEAVNLLESGEALDDSQDELLEEVTDKTEKASQREQESREKFAVEICESEAEESGKIEITEYLVSCDALVDVLGMVEIADSVYDAVYESNGFSLTWVGIELGLFSIDNEGADNVLLYGISLGDNISDIDEILDTEGWWTYYSGAIYYPIEGTYANEYLNIIGDEHYLLHIVYDGNSQIIEWYLNNWPELEDYEDAFAHVEENALRKKWTAAYESILDEYREVCIIDSEEYLAAPEKYEEMYPDVNSYVIMEYHIPAQIIDESSFLSGEELELYYAFYDIDQNGIPELVVSVKWADRIDICALYAYDGSNAVKLFTEYSVDILEGEVDMLSLNIYEDGVIMLGSGDSTLYCFSDDGYTLSWVSWNDWNVPEGVDIFDYEIDLSDYYELLAE